MDDNKHYFGAWPYDASGEYRIDVYFKENGKDSKTLELLFVTTSGTYSIVDLLPESVKRLAVWMGTVAQDVIVDNRQRGK